MSTPTQLQQSRDFCHRIAERAGSSFVPAFRLLPEDKREAMIHLYAFMRHTDDIGDSDAPVERKREELDAWEEALRGALDGTENSDVVDDLAEHGSRPADGTYRADGAYMPALAETVQRFGIPPSSLFAVIDGVRMDLEPREYRTFDELAEYCRRVASAVGIACIHIWGVRDPEEAAAAADKCGLAFQLTNILRDIREDAARGRVYLPTEDLAECGSSPELLRRGPAEASFEEVIRFEVARAKALYREGAALGEYLDRDGRRVFGMMTEVYYRLLLRIESDWRSLFARRIRLSRPRKTWIAMKWFLFPPGRIRLG